MHSAGEIFPLVHMGRLKKIGRFVVLSRLVLLHDFSPRHIYPCVQILYLHGGDALHINLNISQQLYKIRVRHQFPQQRSIHSPRFQYIKPKR